MCVPLRWLLEGRRLARPGTCIGRPPAQSQFYQTPRGNRLLCREWSYAERKRRRAFSSRSGVSFHRPIDMRLVSPRCPSPLVRGCPCPVALDCVLARSPSKVSSRSYLSALLRSFLFVSLPRWSAFFPCRPLASTCLARTLHSRCQERQSRPARSRRLGPPAFVVRNGPSFLTRYQSLSMRPGR